MQDCLVCTGDINQDYEILKPVHYYHLSLMNKETFGEKNIDSDEVIDKIIEILKEETIESGGNGIIFLRIEFQLSQLGGTHYLVYGTMIKIK